MASIQETEAGFAIHWRLGGRQFKQSAGTTDQSEAEAIRGRVEDTLRALREGWKSLPEGADYETAKLFVWTGGRKSSKEAIAAPSQSLTLDGLFASYRESRPSNEDSTLYTEKIHQDHITRLMGADKQIRHITFSDIQTFADRRKAGYESRIDGKVKSFAPVGPATINKELKTLSKIWNWAINRDLVSVAKPWESRNVDMGRAKPRERFRDFDEITEIIKQGGLSESEQISLWKSLYLRGPDVADLLEWVRGHASAAFVYPMFTLCALTGCRRSEAIRAQRRDFNFQRAVVTLRGKKQDSSQEFTFRDVPMNSLLAQVMKEWFANHPGGQFAIVDEEGRPVRIRSGRLDREFEATLKGGKWEVMRGWHCLRHSFASILASKGVDQRVIDKFMGHLDPRTVACYQHLFKESGQVAVNSLME